MECDNLNKECTPQKPELGLWIISYLNRENRSYRGLAVVKAIDAHNAECVFRAESQHNSHNEDIKIINLYEIGISYEPALLAEEYFEVEEP